MSSSETNPFSSILGIQMMVIDNIVLSYTQDKDIVHGVVYNV